MRHRFPATPLAKKPRLLPPQPRVRTRRSSSLQTRISRRSTRLKDRPFQKTKARHLRLPFRITAPRAAALHPFCASHAVLPHFPAALSTASESPFPYRDTLTRSRSLLRCTTSCDLSISSLSDACGGNLTGHQRRFLDISSAKRALSTVYTVHVRYNYIVYATKSAHALLNTVARLCTLLHLPVLFVGITSSLLLRVPHTRNYHSTSNENPSPIVPCVVPPCATCLLYTTPTVCCSACSWRQRN